MTVKSSNKSGMAQPVSPGDGRSPGAKSEIYTDTRQSPLMAQPVSPGDGRSPVKTPSVLRTPSRRSASRSKTPMSGSASGSQSYQIGSAVPASSKSGAASAQTVHSSPAQDSSSQQSRGRGRPRGSSNKPKS